MHYSWDYNVSSLSRSNKICRKITENVKQNANQNLTGKRYHLVLASHSSGGSWEGDRCSSLHSNSPLGKGHWDHVTGTVTKSHSFAIRVGTLLCPPTLSPRITSPLPVHPIQHSQHVHHTCASNSSHNPFSEKAPQQTW